MGVGPEAVGPTIVVEEGRVGAAQERWTVARGASRAERSTAPACQHVDEVLRIAGSCFRYSRFHLDHLVPNAIANRIKREWISSYIQRKRGDKLFVAVKGDAPVGFLAATTGISDGKRTAIIELIGVDLAFQGQGIGMALVGTFIRTYRNTCEVLQVGTQAVNIPSMRLYERMGFHRIPPFGDYRLDPMTVFFEKDCRADS